MLGKRFQKLTPKQAWDQYVYDLCDESVEMFISVYYNDNITDFTEMCRDYVKDIPRFTGRFYDQDQLDRIAILLEQYINEKGYDETKLYSKKELDDLCDSDIEAILKITGKYRRW